jgi:hypothetical protein
MSTSTKFVVSSMSRRRIASNIPVLDSHLCIPSSMVITNADILSPASGSSTPPPCQSLSSLTLSETPSVPRTPECQLIPKCQSPPNAPRQVNIQAKYKLSLTSSISLQNMNYPSYPFTPLDDELQSPSLPISIQGGTGLEALLPQYRQIGQVLTPLIFQEFQSSLPNNRPNHPHLGQQPAIDLIRRRVLPAPARRLPFIRCNSSPGLSTLHSAFPRASLTHPIGLASPVILDGTTHPRESPQPAQPSPLQQSMSFPASPGYFNLVTSRK